MASKLWKDMELVIKPIIFSEGYLVFQGLFTNIVGQHGLNQTKSKPLVNAWIHLSFQFFVASDPTVKEEKLWHDKYSLRKSMVPSFITMEQARKVSLDSCPLCPQSLDIESFYQTRGIRAHMKMKLVKQSQMSSTFALGNGCTEHCIQQTHKTTHEDLFWIISITCFLESIVQNPNQILSWIMLYRYFSLNIISNLTTR